MFLRNVLVRITARELNDVFWLIELPVKAMQNAVSLFALWFNSATLLQLLRVSAMISSFFHILVNATSIGRIIKKGKDRLCQREMNFARKVQLGPRVSGYGRTSWSTVTRWNSEGAKRAKNSGQKRRWRREGRGARRGISREGTSRGHGRRPVDRSSGQTDGKTDRRLETAHYGRRMREECGGSGLFDTINIGSEIGGWANAGCAAWEKRREWRRGEAGSAPRGWGSEGKPMNGARGPTTMPGNLVTTSS